MYTNFLADVFKNHISYVFLVIEKFNTIYFINLSTY